MYLLIKLTISAAVIVAVSEVARWSPRLGGLIASLPLVSILAMLWLHVDTRDASAVATLSREIFWLVLPSLLLFVVLPWLLRIGVNFYAALAASAAVTVIGYAGTLVLLARLGPGGPS